MFVKLGQGYSKYNPGFILGDLIYRNNPSKKKEARKNYVKGVRNERWGLGNMYASGFLIALVYFCINNVLTFIFIGLKTQLEPYWVYVSIMTVISYSICHFFVFKQDQFLIYFNEFKKMNPVNRRFWFLACGLFNILIIACFFGGLHYYVLMLREIGYYGK